MLIVTSRRDVIAMMASVLLLSACGSGSAAIAQSSTFAKVAIAWFNAINTNELRAAHKLFEPGQVDQISWMIQPTADQSKFTDIHCHNTVMTQESGCILHLCRIRLSD
jgi:hypothetical protein